MKQGSTAKRRKRVNSFKTHSYLAPRLEVVEERDLCSVSHPGQRFPSASHSAAVNLLLQTRHRSSTLLSEEGVMLPTLRKSAPAGG